MGQTEAVKPFSGSNEQGLAGKGGKYSKGDPWTSHVVVSGNLVTGQNPQSAEAFAEAVVKALACARIGDARASPPGAPPTSPSTAEAV